MIVGDITHVKHLSEAHVYVAIKQTLWARYACISSETGISPENGRSQLPKRSAFFSIGDDQKRPCEYWRYYSCNTIVKICMLQLNNVYCIIEVHCEILLVAELVNIARLKQIT